MPWILHLWSNLLTFATWFEKLVSYVKISSINFFMSLIPSNAASMSKLYLSPVELKPIGARQNIYRPHGVMKVVSGCASSDRGICHYPFNAYIVVKYLCLGGISETTSFGLGPG